MWYIFSIWNFLDIFQKICLIVSLSDIKILYVRSSFIYRFLYVTFSLIVLSVSFITVISNLLFVSNSTFRRCLFFCFVLFCFVFCPFQSVYLFFNTAVWIGSFMYKLHPNLSDSIVSFFHLDIELCFFEFMFLLYSMKQF